MKMLINCGCIMLLVALACLSALVILSSLERSSSSSSRLLGTVFISEALDEGSHQLALDLAGQGVHVLLGYRGDEKGAPRDSSHRSYASQLPLERIPFRLEDPTTLVDVLYRLKALHKEFHRPLSAVVINTLGAEKWMKLIENPTLNDEVDGLDESYRVLLKSTNRLLQVSLAVFREEAAAAAKRSQEKARKLARRQGQLATFSSEPRISKNSVHLHGRIIVLTNSSHLVNSEDCGPLCIVQASVQQLLDQTQRLYGRQGLKTSTIFVEPSHRSPISQRGDESTCGGATDGKAEDPHCEVEWEAVGSEVKREDNIVSEEDGVKSKNSLYWQLKDALTAVSPRREYYHSYPMGTVSIPVPHWSTLFRRILPQRICCNGTQPKRWTALVDPSLAPSVHFLARQVDAVLAALRTNYCSRMALSRTECATNLFEDPSLFRDVSLEVSLQTYRMAAAVLPAEWMDWLLTRFSKPNDK